VAVAAVALVAGSDDREEAATTATTAATTVPASPTTPATTATTRDPVLGNGESVTIAFGGDTNFEGTNADRLAADPASVLAPVAAVLGGADLAVVNLETALGTGGTPAPKEFVFQAPALALEAFRAAGVDVVSAANNHGMDFGVEGLQETLGAERSAGFPIIGIGADESEAYAPFLAEVRGQRIAVLGATQVLDDDLVDEWTAGPTTPGLASAKRVDRLVQAVGEARAIADTVVVYVHWGVERETCPTTSQQDLAAALVAAGADVIVGGHAHRLQGGGRLGDAVVHYGLGNFSFQTSSVDGARTGVFVVTVTGRRVDAYDWLPGRITDHQPHLLDGAERDEALAHWEGLRGCTGLSG
jgi:poly-gamma-glutamate capsule biosynthesis protein CapA/YwtB (metallophosphatase superfamily)